MFATRKTGYRSEKGSVFAELSLLLPVLILILIAMYDISRIFYLQNTLEYASKEAARIGASIKESVDGNFMSKDTVSRSELENLIVNSVRIRGVVEEPGQFMISYLNRGGNEIMGVQNNLPFNRRNNPGAIDYVVVEITYPGVGSRVNTPIPLFFTTTNIFPQRLTLMSRAVFKMEGRFEREGQ